MFVSVILATYNSPDWLEKVLWGYHVQSHRDFEIVIADDGSDDATLQLIHRFRERTGMAISHVWHDDRGFRKCTILNRAILEASADYLIFSDGDCIPRADFLAQHVLYSRPGFMLSGGCVRLPKDISQRIGIDDIVFGRATDPSWLGNIGLRDRPGRRKLKAGKWSSHLLDLLTTTRATFNGGNASAWREDVLRVNGFDERMEHGGLDRELGERLSNTGVRARQIRYRALCLHLYHERGYVRKEAVRFNEGLREATRREHSVWTPYGILKDRDEPSRKVA